MRTALDTNVISEMMDAAPQAGAVAQALEVLREDGPLIICGVVYAELHAKAKASRALIDSFLGVTGVTLDPEMDTAIWAEAGRANADHHARKRASGERGVRPVLPDFLIGAHALHRADRLFTLNLTDFSDFPALTVVTL